MKKALSSWVAQAFAAMGLAVEASEVEASFEIPREEKFGDLSTHLCLKLAKIQKKNPRAISEALVKELERTLGSSALKGRVERICVEGPGFVNFYWSAAELSSVLLRIEKEGARFGSPRIVSRKILLEYVSANPTGPLTVAHGRQAALGDSLGRILRFCGHQVTTEYYNNDEGVQIQTLGKSTQFRVAEILDGPQGDIPENYYRGEYLIQIAKDLLAKTGEAAFRKLPAEEAATLCRVYARDRIMETIRRDLKEFDVNFDSFYSQEELGRSGKVEKTLEDLKKRGKVFESEGAVWLRSTEYGDDKDRVLIKSDGNYTYLTPDIAYHHDKFERGFDTLIDILGPDHHGYILRLKASQASLGHDAERIHVLIAQLVTLYEGDKQVRMSTRAGEFVTLRQVLDDVGRDAGRFFFVMRKFDAHLDFDLALAKSQTPENPVFYIQYAHARIESIKSQAVEKGAKTVALGQAALHRLGEPQELRVLRLLGQFEDNVLGAERTLEPYRLVPYLQELAGAFHRFYTENRVVTDDLELTGARLALIDGVQKVIRSGLGLLGVSAPLKM